jgi:hypothetical protein
VFCSGIDYCLSFYGICIIDNNNNMAEQNRAVYVCDDDVMISIETSLCFVVASTIVYPFTEFVSLIITTTWQSRAEQCMCVMMMS